MSLSKQFTRREKVLMTVLALLMVGAAYFFAVHQPVEASLEQIAARRDEAGLEVMVLEAKQARLDEMRRELEEILAQPNAPETPKYDNLQQLMVFLNAIMGPATDYSLSFQNVEAPEEGQIVRRVVDMSFTCTDYGAARAAVEHLRDCPFRCQIGALTMAPAGAGQDAPAAGLTGGAVQVSLSITFFESLEQH